MKKKTSVLLWSLALAVLAAELVFVNRPPENGEVHSVPEEESASEVSAAEETREVMFGNQPGEILPDFSITLTNGTEFILSGMKGRIVFINLWATWCAPCVKELPFFDRLQAEHPDDVFVLAVHSNLITDDVDAYLEKFDYKTAFAVDVSGDVYSLVGGSTMLPQTIILNREGKVTYNQVGSVTYEVLEELLRQAEMK